MLQVGIAGIGFMGMIHYLAYQRVPGVKVGALCEPNTKRLAGDWRDIKGNFGPPGKVMDLAGVRKYHRLEEMLADKKLDFVDLCLPPSMHADASVAASKAGKHVFCEKPIALTVADGARMVKAAAAAKKLLCIGHVLPFFPEYAFALETVRKGKYGKLLGGHFKRVISDPLWLPDYYKPDKIGGPLLDLHIHDAHFIRLLFGMPSAVFSRGRMRGEVVEFLESQFLCKDESQVVTATSGVIRQQGRAFTHAYEIHLEKATLLFDFAVIDGKPHVATPVTVMDDKGKVHRPDLGSGDPVDAFVAELKEIAKAVKSGKPSAILGGDLAADAITLCQRQAQSVASGKLVKV